MGTLRILRFLFTAKCCKHMLPHAFFGSCLQQIAVNKYSNCILRNLFTVNTVLPLCCLQYTTTRITCWWPLAHTRTTHTGRYTSVYNKQIALLSTHPCYVHGAALFTVNGSLWSWHIVLRYAVRCGWLTIVLCFSCVGPTNCVARL